MILASVVKGLNVVYLTYIQGECCKQKDIRNPIKQFHKKLVKLTIFTKSSTLVFRQGLK